LLRFPEQKFSVVCQCNLGSTNPTQFARQVAEIYLADQMTAVEERRASGAAPDKDVAMGATELQRYVGIFRDPRNGSLQRITLRDGKLRLDSFGPSSAELAPLGNARFIMAGAVRATDITFEQGGKAMVVTRQTDPPETERFERAEAFAPTAAELAAYAGTYYSEELDATYVLSVKDGKLWTRVRFNPPGELRPAVRDVFVGPFGIRVEFQWHGKDRASFVVQAGRVRNIRFVRRLVVGLGD
jgi:hypothetical protein